MKFKILSLFLLCFAFSLKAQNWNAFNKDYRYNYVYDYNALVTNVLFADSVKAIGPDTVYYMNRIGVECSGSCPTLTTPITGTVVVGNMPQFLQRKIIKTSGGLVQLKDTGNWVIKPTCTLTETWIYDSLSLKTAQCVNISTLSIFSVVDSVKTIIADGTDTILLTKQFGIIQFPNMYGKNKYYRLVGIENASSYDQISLYGYKVPNAWDFYNYDIGDKFCNSNNTGSVLGPSWYQTTQNLYEKTITNKIILPGIGITYTWNQIRQETITSTFQSSVSTTSSLTINTITLTDTLNKKRIENTMYPSQMVRNPTYLNTLYNIVKFGTDINNKFYKFFGPLCQTYPTVNIPYNNYHSLINSGNYYQTSSAIFEIYTSSYGEGLGQVSFRRSATGLGVNNCLTCAVKNGTLYLGAETSIGVNEINQSISDIVIYPNPTSENITVESIGSNFDFIEVYNVLGQKITSAEIKNLNKIAVNLNTLNSGIYFLKVYSRTKLIKVEKIIKE